MKPSPGPLLSKQEVVAVGPFSVRLLSIDRLEDLVDRDALLRDGDAPEPPYWAHVWAGGRVLAELVATRIECRGRRVLEVGCGLGLAGIVAALRGGRVVLTDRLAEPLSFVRRSAQLNGCSVDVAQIDLRAPGLRGPFDLCLAADMTYEPALQTALADLLAEQLSSQGEAWCVESVRTTDGGFHRACRDRGLHLEEHDLFAMDEGHRVAIRASVVSRG